MTTKITKLKKETRLWKLIRRYTGIRMPFKGYQGYEWQIRAVVFFLDYEKWNPDNSPLKGCEFIEYRYFSEYGDYMLRIGRFTVFNDPYWRR